MSDATKKEGTKGDGNYTLTIPKKRNSDEVYTIQIKDIDEVIWNGAQKLIRKEKELEAVKLLIKNLRVSGDDATEICNNFYALRAATAPLLELIQPMDGTLKKN